jgi:hypothetical protein
MQSMNEIEDFQSMKLTYIFLQRLKGQHPPQLVIYSASFISTRATIKSKCVHFQRNPNFITTFNSFSS